MNRQKSIVLFAAIAAVAMTTIGLTGVSASPLMVASLPQSEEGMVMLGHVEYTVFGADGLVKAYNQADNLVVADGKDCVANRVFGITPAAGLCGHSGNGAMTYIAIGNDTSVAVATSEQQLSSSSPGNCASTSVDGEMARKLVTPTIQTGATGSAGTIVTLEVANPFTFSGSSNATGSGTTIHQSGIFNADQVAKNANGECTTLGAPDTNWNMFSVQDLNGGSGIAVTDGDSLSVKWTITIGGP